MNTSRARASRVTDGDGSFEGGEDYKEKGEPIGMKPDRLVVTVVDCASLRTLSLDFSFWCHWCLLSE